MIRLYALSTGQNAKGILNQAVASPFATPGGHITAVPAYFNGMPVYPGDLRSTIGYAEWPQFAPGTLQSAVPMGANVVNLQLDSAATTALLSGQAVQAIQDNPRLVSVATISGQDASAGRREAAANVLQPNFVTS